MIIRLDTFKSARSHLRILFINVEKKKKKNFGMIITNIIFKSTRYNLMKEPDRDERQNITDPDPE